MTTASEIGNKIKSFRKAKNLTLEQLADAIGKSKSTLSKYESGKVVVDVLTLCDIAEALNISPSSFIDFVSMRKPRADSKSDLDFYNTDTLYLYYYDGRKKKRIKSVIKLDREGYADRPQKAFLFSNISDYNTPEKCKHYYEGSIQISDTLTYLSFSNVINPVETLHIVVLNSLENTIAYPGTLTGFSQRPYGNITFRVIVSRAKLYEQSPLLDELVFTKEDMRSFRNNNAMMVAPLAGISD